MTARERRIAQLAAEDLEGWARELPLGSETRRDLQQSARAYRLVARAGEAAVALRAVPDVGAADETASTGHGVAPRAGDRASSAPNLVEVSAPLEPGLDRGA